MVRIKQALFLCSNFEPGRCGVGDYTRRLAAECIRQGVDCRVIALNDQHLSGDSKIEEEQFDGPTAVRCLRLSSRLSWKSRIAIARSWKEGSQPDFLSLQFVPYGYQPKGLPFGLARRLRSISGLTPWHVMFHELWIGMQVGCSHKDWLVGSLQRAVIRHVLRNIHPRLVSTQSKIYQQQLRGLGVEARQLKLFGNIPVSFTASRPSDSILQLVVFGSIHQTDLIETFAEECRSLSEQLKCTIKVTFVGRCGSEKVRWMRILDKVGIGTCDLGECNSTEVSQILARSSIGLCTTPMHLVEKSGSVAAMLEHGLFVLCLAMDWRPRNTNSLPQVPDVRAFVPGGLAQFVEEARAIRRHEWNVTECAKAFLADLDSIHS